MSAIPSSSAPTPSDLAVVPAKGSPKLGLSRERPLPLARLPEAVAPHIAPATRPVWLSGTIQDFRRGSGNVVWFALRDGATVLDCMSTGASGSRIARLMDARAGDVGRDAAPIGAGERVVVCGALGLDRRRVGLRFRVVDLARETEVPSLTERERVRQVLEQDGLLRSERKRRLPRVPRRIALIASPGTAGHLDVMSVARARHPGIPIELVPAIVQGDVAPASLVKALRRALDVAECDVIIVARGGGSAADLAAFDDEQVARAIAASPIPVVTGVGHETDVSLADCVADVRAATPTAAAMVAVPLRSELEAEHSALQRGLAQALHARLERERSRLAGAGPALARSLQLLLATGRRTLDQQERDVRLALLRRLGAERAGLEALGRRLHERSRDGLERRQVQRDRLAAQLVALGPSAILARGYAIPLDASGDVLDRVERFPLGTSFTLRLHDGEVQAQVTDAAARSAPLHPTHQLPEDS